MLFKFTPPARYDLNQIILGECATVSGTLIPVASSLVIGTFPTWISEYTYAASGQYFYSTKWKYNNGTYSDWSSPRMMGRTGIETDYIIVNAPTVSSIYIMNPVSGDVASYSSTWLEYNKEYTLTIDKSLTGVLTLPIGEDYVLEFTSAYCPAFVTVNDVRYEVGDFINNLTDDTVNRIIHKNSKYIVFKYLEFTGTLPTNYSCEGSLMAEAFRRYVLCKTALDGITAIQLSTGGNVTKKLADVTFQYGGIDSGKDPNNKKKDLKDCVDNALNVIFSGHNFKIGVRGKYFGKMKHPMNDDSYGRLSLVNKNYTKNWHSAYDLVNNEDPSILVTSSGVV